VLLWCFSALVAKNIRHENTKAQNPTKILL